MIAEQSKKTLSCIKEENNKIMMVGDGLNDLEAITEADIGVRVSKDKKYAATFNIDELSKIKVIINESKNTCKQIIQIVQFFCLVRFINCITSIIILPDNAYKSNMQSMLEVLSLDTPLAVFLCFSSTSKDLNTKLLGYNFMSWHNQLLFWGNCIIMTISYLAGYFYYYHSQDFASNPQEFTYYDPTSQDFGYNISTKSATIMFFMMMLWFNGLGFIIYRSKPYKQKIWTNLPLTILLIINSMASLSLFFLSGYLSFFNFVQINIKQSVIVLSITIVGIFLCQLYNYLIQKKFGQREKEKEKEKEKIKGEDKYKSRQAKVNPQNYGVAQRRDR